MSHATSPEGSALTIFIRCVDLEGAQRFYVDELGFRLKGLYPADAPRSVLLEGYGVGLQLNTADEGLAAIRPLATTLELEAPLITHASDGDAWSDGRAGMRYRDLLPTRLGGALIASHIRIPHGGPVPDYVHYHDVHFQFIYCLSGWVRLLYEDQGDAFLMRAGDCVVQPPGLRHRVLECSDGFDVVEFSSPAEHMTWVEHELDLPNDHRSPGHRGGQTFLHFQAEHAAWATDWQVGWKSRSTGTLEATGGKASLALLAPSGADDSTAASALSGAGALLFSPSRAVITGVVTRGSAELSLGTHPREQMVAGSAFACWGNTPVSFAGASADFQWLALEFG